MKSVRVLVVDDSAVCREQLREILHRDDIEVVAEASDGARAIELASSARPDLVTLDLDMPGIGGFEVIEQVMARTPVPILVVTSLPGASTKTLVYEAIRRGALDLAEKPRHGDTAAEEALREQVRHLAHIPVVVHVAGKRRPRPPRAARTMPGGRARVVGIGASAGGPAAVVGVLSKLAPEFPAAVALVQHLPVGFEPSFASFLRIHVRLPVELVDGPTTFRAGTVYLASGDRHLEAISAETLASVDGPRVHGYRPSVSRLFASLADRVGPAAAGVILTGIGSDGADGLARLRSAGGATAAQDEDSSSVYGMPRAAAEAGAVETVLPLGDVAPWMEGVAR